MTEQEAKEKWCPRQDPMRKSSHCIGSGCMAWRWRDIIVKEGSNMSMWPHDPPVWGKSETEGYCGLAGRP